MPPYTRRGMSLLSAHAYLMLIGACDPVLCPNWGARSNDTMDGWERFEAFGLQHRATVRGATHTHPPHPPHTRHAGHVTATRARAHSLSFPASLPPGLLTEFGSPSPSLSHSLPHALSLSLSFPLSLAYLFRRPSKIISINTIWRVRVMTVLFS